MRLFLLSGIPGMGKTTVGNYLEEKHGFKHTNFEGPNGQPNRKKITERLVLSLLADLQQDTVFSWGFGPNQPRKVEIVKLILQKGAKMFWFDGNRQAAEKSFLIRDNYNPSSRRALARQMRRIDSVNLKQQFNPIFYDTFDEKGRYKDLETIAQDLFKLASNN